MEIFGFNSWDTKLGKVLVGKILAKLMAINLPNLPIFSPTT